MTTSYVLSFAGKPASPLPQKDTMPNAQWQTFYLPGALCNQSKAVFGVSNVVYWEGQWVLDKHRQGTLTWINNAVQSFTKPQGFAWNPTVSSYNDHVSDAGIDWGPLDNQALARFNGRLRGGDSSSLGVTAATWRQSAGMITGRLQQVSSILGGTLKRLSGSRSARKSLKGKDPETTSANSVLEVEFGWKPLYEDLKSAFAVLGGDIPPSWVSGRHKTHVVRQTSTGSGSSDGDPLRRYLFVGDAHATVCGTVRVTNQNLWLLNKLGLISPLPIAVDLIPWSWVVGMFVNLNQMVNSLSNEVGLEILNRSTTHTADLKLYSTVDYNGAPGTASSVIRAKSKYRSVGSHPTVTWQAKVPNVNFELCAITSALVVQQANRISKFFR